MLNGSCHCGNVRIDVPDRPATLILCNCSICRRNGALWAFYPREDVRLAGHPEHTRGYVWGARSIETFRCTGCGCVTHWEPLTAEAGQRLGINIRNFDPHEIGDVRLRRFDGAQTWDYID
jgi:hypothetical protein